MSEIHDGHRPSGPSCPRPSTILLIEDERSVRESTGEILRNVGYSVTEAVDGLDALLCLSREIFSVVLLDLGLPRLDGRHVLQALYNPPPVVVISALDHGDLAEFGDYFGSKVFACLRKPVPPPQLLAALSDATGRQPAA
jgi:CheY-like chemotaxis protein